jgi:hypothetical protein
MTAPPLSSLRALSPPAGGAEAEDAWRWVVEAPLPRPAGAGAVRAALGPRWLSEHGAATASLRVEGQHAGWPAQLPLDAAPESALVSAILIEWELLARGQEAPGPTLAPGGWVIVHGRADDGEGVPDEGHFQHRLVALAEALAPLRPGPCAPSLPPAVAAERAKALDRLRRAWGARVVLRLLAPPPGWEPGAVWAALTHQLGLRALPDERLGFVPVGADRPLFDARGWDGGAAARAHRPGPARKDGLVQGLELSFRPGAVPDPEAVLAALLQVADWLRGALGGALLDEEDEALDERLLRDAVRLVVTGLAAHGLRPGRGPTRLLQGRPVGAPPALRVVGRA